MQITAHSPIATPMTPAPGGRLHEARREEAPAAPGAPQRDVAFAIDRVEGAERAAHHLAGRSLANTDEPREPEERREGLARRIEETRERLSDPPDLTVTAKNLGVTYEIHPDLRLPFQGEVFDRGTTEIVRQIPSDPRIAFAKRYQQFIGGNLDVSA